MKSLNHLLVASGSEGVGRELACGVFHRVQIHQSMKSNKPPMKHRIKQWQALAGITITALALGLNSTSHAQTATWTGGAADGLWNTALNWDIGVPAEGTNAVIGAGNIVDYSVPMAAGSFGSLTLNGVVNLNANGFVSGAAGAISLAGSAARLFVNNGGVLSATNGGLTFGTAAGGTVMTGGSVILQSGLRMGGSGAGNT